MKRVAFLLLLLFLASCSNQVQQTCHRIDYKDVYTSNVQTTINDGEITKGQIMNTGSMLPTITNNSTVLYKQVSNENDLCVGDIILYNETAAGCPNGYADIVIHRIVEKGYDENGIYFYSKGDNNNARDSCKIRMEDIKLVVVGILY